MAHREREERSCNQLSYIPLILLPFWPIAASPKRSRALQFRNSPLAPQASPPSRRTPDLHGTEEFGIILARLCAGLPDLVPANETPLMMLPIFHLKRILP